MSQPFQAEPTIMHQKQGDFNYFSRDVRKMFDQLKKFSQFRADA